MRGLATCRAAHADRCGERVWPQMQRRPAIPKNTIPKVSHVTPELISAKGFKGMFLRFLRLGWVKLKWIMANLGLSLDT
eukprot:5394225-Amphidinium_carterae.1